MKAHDRFDGRILGVGTSRGVRLVVGDWYASPFGRFSDVMVAHADGRRGLLAPTPQIAEYVASTYHFDDVTVCDVVVETSGVSDAPSAGQVPSVRRGARIAVAAGPLRLVVSVGDRHPWGYALAAVPHVLRRPALARVMDPAARMLMPGVRTYGSAGSGRDEAYVARDLRRVASLEAAWAGESLGRLADVDPPPRFGFSSSPRMPSLTRVTTYVLTERPSL